MNELTHQPAASPSWLTQKCLRLFGIDVRSLAILRISLGVVILVILIRQFWQMELFYTDNGILTREMSQDFFENGTWSLFWFSGGLRFAQAMFGLTALAAVALTVGYKTRIAVVACLVLVASIQFRNPLVLSSGHVLLRVMLFWSVFLPLGSVWSLDAKLGPYKDPEKVRVLTLATVGIMLQVACLYFFSGISKLNEVWLNGQAVEFVMSYEMYVRPLGDSLRNFPFLLKGATWITLIAELAVPVLLFTPRVSDFTRGMAMAFFWLMHLVVWLTMSTGTFSFLAMTCWFIFVPHDVWEWCSKSIGDSSWDYVGNWTVKKVVMQVFCGIAIILMLLLNVDAASQSNWLPESARSFANKVLVGQSFCLHGDPGKTSPRYEYAATMQDGTTMDIFWEMMNPLGQSAATEYDYFISHDWRRIHSNLMNPSESKVTPQMEQMRQRLLNQIVQRWNETHTSQRQVVTASLVQFERPIELNNKWGPESSTTWATWSRK